MKTEYRLFLGIALFLAAMAVVYPLWTNGELGAVDWVGTVALILSFLLCAMCGGYFWFVSRRIDLRPEDRLDADIADAAGEVGFFSPGSYWPFGIGLCATMTFLGVALWMWWLIAVGIVATLLTASAMLFEYYSGTRRTAEH
jgi:hypothetical protein